MEGSTSSPSRTRGAGSPRAWRDEGSPRSSCTTGSRRRRSLDAAAADRPSFLAPVYPAWWGEIPVPQPAPPLFLAWASDDEFGGTVVDACTQVYGAWSRTGASVEAHAYASGGHGFGMRTRCAPSDGWFETFLGWLTASGL